MVKDAQVKGLFMNMSEGKPLYVSAQKSDMCENTARKYVRSQRFPSDLKHPHTWRTRPDPFLEVWPRVEAILTDEPQLEAKAAFGTVEPVFANICSTIGLNRITLRGKVKADTQWKLYSIVHNIFKIYRYGTSYAH